MNTDRDCGCKSFRSCYICEGQYGIAKGDAAKELVQSFPKTYTFCYARNKLFSSDAESAAEEGIDFPGVKIIPDFITVDEEARLIAELDAMPWDSSQSGRRKQNFGPKANFKKRKTKCGDFRGFPTCTKFVQDRFHSVPCLEGYRTVEQCSIEYRPETGACIEPHIDDCWIWGERIVQLNLLSESHLSFTPFNGGNNNKYNLADVATFPRVLDETGKVVFNPFAADAIVDNQVGRRPYQRSRELLDGVVRVPLPRRSLLVLYGEPRYDWEHCILREDISERRVVLAYREFTPPYLPGGGQEVTGRGILEEAEKFWS